MRKNRDRFISPCFIAELARRKALMMTKPAPMKKARHNKKSLFETRSVTNFNLPKKTQHRAGMRNNERLYACKSPDLKLSFNLKAIRSWEP